MTFFASPQAFTRMLVRIAIALLIVGIAGLVDGLYVFPFALMLLAFAALTWLTGTDTLYDTSERESTLANRSESTEEPDAAEVPEHADSAEVAEPTHLPEPAEAPAPATIRTFRLSTTVDAEAVCLVGDFNDWSHTAHQMQRDGGWFSADVELEPGRAYRYRYLLDGHRWENDWSADAYVPNCFGSEDSVIRT